MYNELAISIIKDAVKDLKDEKASESDKNSARLFFKSDWFETLCMCLDINKDTILDRIKDYL
jgi:hypothetical protein